MKAEREAKALLEKNEEVSQELLYVLGRTESTLYKEITGEDAPTTPVSSSTTAVEPSPSSSNSDAGDPNSPRKIRARRMRAERTAREHIEKSEEVPTELMAILRDTESSMYAELGGTESPQVAENETSNADNQQKILKVMLTHQENYVLDVCVLKKKLANYWLKENLYLKNWWNELNH